MPKMVINTCYGGFSLSDAAHRRLGSVYVEADDTEYGFGYWNTNPWNQGMEQDSWSTAACPLLSKWSNCCATRPAAPTPDSRSWTFPTTPTCRTSRSTTGVSRSERATGSGAKKL